VRIWEVDGDGTGSAFEFAEVGAVQVLEDVEEAVDEEGVVLDELVVLRDIVGARRRSYASMAFPKGGAAIASCAGALAPNPSGSPPPEGELVAAG
jgi:hypothetical protein